MRRFAPAVGLLCGCSVINAYDEVVPGDGDGTTGTGATTTTTTGTSTGGGGSGTGGMGGGGGMMLSDLVCEVVGAPSTIEDLSSEPAGSRDFGSRGMVYQPNGDTVRVFAHVGLDLRALEVQNGQVVNMAFEPNVQEVIDSAVLPSGAAAILVARPKLATSGYPLDLLVYDAGIGSPTVFQVDSGGITSNAQNTGSPRGTFLHVGPGSDRIDVALGYQTTAGTRVAIFFRHIGNNMNSQVTGLIPPMPFGGNESGTPREVFRRGNEVHVIVGQPTSPMAQASLHFTFDETTTGNVTNPSLVGPPGTIFVDGYQLPSGDLHVAMGDFDGMGGLQLFVGTVPPAAFSTLDVGNLNGSKTFASLLDVPSSGDPEWVGDMFPLFGGKSSVEEMSLILVRPDGVVRFDDDAFFTATDFEYAEFAKVASGQPVTEVGGILYLVWTERYGAGMATQHEKMKIARVACGPEP